MLYLSGGAETGQSAGKAADALKANLQELEDERKAATLKAEHMATKSQRLAEAIENLQAGALRAMRQRDEAAARELLQEKTIVTTALQKSKDRAALNFALAEKLNKLIGAKQTELIALLHQSGSLQRLSQKPFSVDPAGMVSMDDTQPGPSGTFEGSQSDQDSERGGRLAPSPGYDPAVLTSQDYQSEEEIDNKFLELERQTLESMMQASRLQTERSTNTQEQDQQRISSGSSASSSGSDAGIGLHSTSSRARTSRTNWWHDAGTNLQQVQQQTGPLESHQAHEMAKDVTTLLTRIVNARVMRGLDPKATQLVDLAVFQVGVAASADPAVRIAPPRTDFSINIRQRLFRDATAVALEACSLSAAGKVTEAWQELASNWAEKRAADSAVARSPDVTGRLAQMFLRSLAELFKLEQTEVERIVHAAVAAHTRAKLLDAVAAVKQAEPPVKADVAIEKMRHLAAVVDSFPPPPRSPEMELVYSGLRGFLGYEDRQVLHEAYQQVSSSQASLRAVADALGMNLSQ
ncbi:MAG: hypothetical protein FRX49_06283 [Trebouxia sp. A1-2]|nr:MAG: hypothetical protein FRX49_06283 [Trebouxia sp. A1-2]